MDIDRYSIVEAAPSAEDYCRLRAESGLTPKTPEEARAAIAGGWLTVHAVERNTDEVAGMARVIGDGSWYFHICDVAVLPAHQRQGIGRTLMEQVLGAIDAAAVSEQPYVTLMADAPGVRLYESLGFVPSAPRSIGMVRRVLQP